MGGGGGYVWTMSKLYTTFFTLPLLRPKYAVTYDTTKKQLLDGISDPDLRELVRHRLPSKIGLKSAAWSARVIPRAPNDRPSIDLSLLNRLQTENSDSFDINEFLLAHELEDGIILLGTQRLAKEWNNSKFKSLDATFKICPKMYYQVFIFFSYFLF